MTDPSSGGLLQARRLCVEMTSIHLFLIFTAANINCIVFWCRQERLNQMNDLVGEWLVTLSDKVHKVEFEHGTTTGKRVIHVDGQVSLITFVSMN